MRILTAIYRTHAAAASVQHRLAELGLGERVHLLPHDHAPVGPLGVRDDAPLLVALRDLNLPAEQHGAYRNALRRGDYLVSVALGEDEVPAAIDVMRCPEDAVAAAARDAGCVDLGEYRRERDRQAGRRQAPVTDRRSR